MCTTAGQQVIGWHHVGIEWAGLPHVEVRLAAANRISRGQKLEILEARREVYAERVRALNEQLLSGELRPLEWHFAMRGEIKRLHLAAYVAGKSGRWEAMTQADFGRIGAILRRQFTYLSRWMNQIREAQRSDTMPSRAQLNARADLYGQAASESFEKGYADEIGLPVDVLPDWPGAGNTSCRANCKCRWAIRIISMERGDYDATWRLGVAEHCRECRQRARHWKKLRVRGGRMRSEVERNGTFA